MQIIDIGTGPPVILIPGVQGRWEWMRPAVDALASGCRVITFSLADEPTSGAPFDETTGFYSYVDQVRAVMDALELKEAAICGVSYGGLIAATFAARFPERTSSLVLVSAMPPSWRPDRRVSFYLRAPRLLSPLFLAGSIRLHREVAAANGGMVSGIRASIGHGWNALRHMFSPLRMSRRIELLSTASLAGQISTTRCPVLIVTGDESLERVMPVQRTLEYTALLPQAQVATLARTGHLGLITRPAAFAAIVIPFVEQTAGRVLSGSNRIRPMEPAPRRNVG